MFEGAMRRKAFFMLVCSRCVAVSAASRLANVVWMFFVVAALDQDHPLIFKNHYGEYNNKN
ncbi:hypothetical protein PanWU01x14_058750 [Parasponia andersonii]|uniref:Uncharacterized protein n=1 Tax=Parasponia andersonii TaxID=3476 RepID=A0A2P5DJ87_PARAD|nr:hypothetical protein PanWU01x14_058750 [Parasponia andersonii]